MSMWYTSGMSCRSGVAIGDCGVRTNVRLLDKTTTESGVQSTRSLCSRVTSGGVRSRVPKICTSGESSDSWTTVSTLDFAFVPALQSDLLHQFR